MKKLIESKLGQDMPGWTFIVALILGLFLLGFLIWLAVKSGRMGVQEVLKIK